MLNADEELDASVDDEEDWEEELEEELEALMLETGGFSTRLMFRKPGRMGSALSIE